MTGEITLRGRVLPIGGLKEKLLAALRGGIKTVLIPNENEKDLAEIPDNVKKRAEDHSGGDRRRGAAAGAGRAADADRVDRAGEVEQVVRRDRPKSDRRRHALIATTPARLPRPIAASVIGGQRGNAAISLRFRVDARELTWIDASALSTRGEHTTQFDRPQLAQGVSREQERSRRRRRRQDRACRKREAARRSTRCSMRSRDALKKGDEVRLVGFGTFSVADRAASRGPQPAHRREDQDRRVEAAEVQGRQGAEGRGQLSVARSAHRPDAAAVAVAAVAFAAAKRDRRVRAISSAGRASRLHRGGRRFESVIAHHLPAGCSAASARPGRVA